MNCHQVQERLDALVDDELDRWTCWRVRRHTARCPICAAAGEETQRVTALARGRTRVAAPPRMKDRLAEALSAMSPAATERTAADARRSGRLPGGAQRLLTWKRSAAWTIGAVTIILVCVAIVRPADSAYAQLLRVAAAYRQIESAHVVGWKLNASGRRIPFEFWFESPNRFLSRGGDALTVSDGRWTWSYMAGRRFVTRQPASRQGPEAWQQMFDVEKYLARVRQGFTIQDLGLETVGGSALRKLRLSGDGFDERETWWVDPDTHLVRRSTGERADDPSGHHWSIESQLTQVQYNVTPPRGLFSLQVPSGVRVVTTANGRPVHFDQLLGDGRVLARREGAQTTIELLGFHQSTRGDLFVLVRPAPYLPLKLVLSDSGGGRYVSYVLDGGYNEYPISTTAFFPEPPVPVRRHPAYRLRVYLNTGVDDPAAESASCPLLATFDALTPQPGPIFLDRAAREFAEQQRGAPFEFIRSSALGRVALFQGRLPEAQAYLEDAAKRESNPNNTDTHTIYLELADVYRRESRPVDARAMLEAAHRAATYDLPNGSTILKAAEAMEQLGDRETARQWAEEILRWRRYSSGTWTLRHAVHLYLRLGGDRSVAEAALERTVREQAMLGFDDAWDLGQQLEMLGHPDLALEAYTKGLETSGSLKSYRQSGGNLFREDAERMIGAVRRLGGDAAVKRLKPRAVAPGL